MLQGKAVSSALANACFYIILLCVDSTCRGLPGIPNEFTGTLVFSHLLFTRNFCVGRCTFERGRDASSLSQARNAMFREKEDVMLERG